MNMREGKWIDNGQVEPGQIFVKPPEAGFWMALIQVHYPSC
jgi:hypothetical protein